GGRPVEVRGGLPPIAGQGAILGVRAAARKPGTTRLVVDVRPKTSVTLRNEGTRVLLVFTSSASNRAVPPKVGSAEPVRAEKAAAVNPADTKEASTKEASTKEASTMETAPTAAPPMEASAAEGTATEASAKEAAAVEAAAQEAASKETATRGTATKETGSKEVAAKQVVPKTAPVKIAAAEKTPHRVHAGEGAPPAKPTATKEHRTASALALPVTATTP